jgi:polyphenol oxidase
MAGASGEVWVTPAGSQMRWQRPDWPLPEGVEAWVTSRVGGCSEHPFGSLNLGLHVGDRHGAVLSNRAWVRRCLPDGLRLQWLNQVHGNRVVTVSGTSGAPRRRTADAAYVNRPGDGAVVLTADCLPVFLASACGAHAAVAHAGWRGLLGDILESTVNAMAAHPSELRVWLGPAIGVCHFEVGEEVRLAFMQKAGTAKLMSADDDLVQRAFVQIPGRPGKWMMDIYALARHRLRQVGVHQIYGGDQCTVCDSEHFYSYRRDGVTGRMASLIYLRQR